MNSRLTTPRRLPPWRLWLIAGALLVPAAQAVQAAAAQTEAKAAPARSRGACPTVRGDARDNCLSEASTRLASTRPSHPAENPEQLMRNALRRCEPLRDPDRQDCVARIRGEGTSTGSVAEGGIYRELVTREVGAMPAPEPSVPPAAPAPPEATK